MSEVTTRPGTVVTIEAPVHHKRLYVQIASALGALFRARQPNANDSQKSWATEWEHRLKDMAEYLPNGSGFDVSPRIDTSKIKRGLIVIHASYHGVDDHGSYNGWTDFTVVVKPDLESGIRVRLKFPDPSDDEKHGDHIHECYREALLARPFVQFPTSPRK